MCFEAEAARCHRSMLANRLERALDPPMEAVHR